MARSDDDSQQNSIREELAEMRVEVKWTKWLAGGALGASALGQASNLAPPSAVFDLIGRLF